MSAGEPAGSLFLRPPLRRREDGGALRCRIRSVHTGSFRCSRGAAVWWVTALRRGRAAAAFPPLWRAGGVVFSLVSPASGIAFPGLGRQGGGGDHASGILTSGSASATTMAPSSIVCRSGRMYRSLLALVVSGGHVGLLRVEVAPAQGWWLFGGGSGAPPRRRHWETVDPGLELHGVDPRPTCHRDMCSSGYSGCFLRLSKLRSDGATTALWQADPVFSSFGVLSGGVGGWWQAWVSFSFSSSRDLVVIFLWWGCDLLLCPGTCALRSVRECSACVVS